RQLAPFAFRTQERAVTEQDYARIAERHTGVQKAAAAVRWTGSWYTARVSVDRLGGREVDGAFRTQLRKYLDIYRMAGYDVEIDPPAFVAVDLALEICLEPGYFRAHVERAVLEV